MADDNDGSRSGRLAYLGALAGGLAHEIRNPLSTINLNLQLLAEEWQDAEGDRGRRALRKIGILQKEAKRLEEILENFLQITRGQKLNISKVQIGSLLNEILDFVTPELRESNVVVHRGLGEPLPEISLDVTLIKQAFINIIRNGKEAMPDGGEMIVKAALTGDFVQIQIIDTGEGISEEKIERIFDPYFTTKKAGTGLGLATTRRIVEDHGGSIHCDSEPQKGTRFEIRLPVANA